MREGTADGLYVPTRGGEELELELHHARLASGVCCGLVHLLAPCMPALLSLDYCCHMLPFKRWLGERLRLDASNNGHSAANDCAMTYRTWLPQYFVVLRAHVSPMRNNVVKLSSYE